VRDPLVDAEDDAATPLTPEERKDLIPAFIAERAHLNEVEQMGVDAAYQWAFQRRRDVLDEALLCRLHHRMFRDVWRWAGQFRTTPRNIGVEPWRVGPDLHQLIGDTRYQAEHGSLAPDEIAVRFHRRLVWIHPFPNGNGRLSRLAADLLITRLGQPRFTWGSGNLIATAQVRKRYIEALRSADREVIEPLLEFARS
jgi:Fic-DOC domain mobile mystery protein B